MLPALTFVSTFLVADKMEDRTSHESIRGLSSSLSCLFHLPSISNSHWSSIPTIRFKM